MLARLRAELPFLFGAATLAVLFVVDLEHVPMIGHPAAQAAVFVWLFCVILFAAIGVMRHADHLAVHLGEPLGTILLTLSAISIEVSLIGALILYGDDNPTLARDTMFAALMIIMNGLVGVALILGALRHRLQDFNAEGARAFLAIILPLAVIALILPNYTLAAPGGMLHPAQAGLFAVFTVALYGVFLMVQTRRHMNFFQEVEAGGAADPDEAPHAGAMAEGHRSRGAPYHAAFLVLTLLPIPLIAEELATVVEEGLEALHAPEALAGVIIALLVLAPEGIAGVAAARANTLQRSINILFGSALSTIALTIPVVVFLSMAIGHSIVLGLEDEDAVLLVLTLVLSMLTFGGVRTDVLKGAVHLILFAVFIVLIVIP